MRSTRLAAAAAITGLVLLAGCSGDDDDATPPPEPVIEGVETTPVDQLANGHVKGDQRVAYPDLPPVGGTHDRYWADCNGVVYDRPVRTENMVHAMEHGAVWIAYNPDLVDTAGVAALSRRVDGEIYLMMSPFPGLDQPISLQSWGHRLKVASADDPRIDLYINTFRANDEYTPEPGASCDIPDRYFKQGDPPAFDPTPLGPDAVSADFE